MEWLEENMPEKEQLDYLVEMTEAGFDQEH